MFNLQFVNVKTGKIFTLTAPHADRAEACVYGQNDARDRQQEDGTLLYFRVISAA